MTTVRVHQLRRHPLPLGRLIRPTLLGIVFALGLVYVVELNLTSRRGFQVRALEQRLSSLKEENQRLGLTVAGLRSMTGMEERIAALGLVPADQVVYVDAAGAAVARK